MPELVINCQNLSCPQPVIRCRQAVNEGADNLVVLVDNPAARENVSRYLTTQGFTVQAEQQGTLTALSAKRAPKAVAPPAATPQANAVGSRMDAENRRLVVLLTAPVIGQADDVLGAKLMENFLSTLPEMGPELWQILLLNGAVKLATSNSSALPQLQKLAESGVRILVCGTCLAHFGLTDNKAVGETTNMLDVVTALQLADSVIRP